MKWLAIIMVGLAAFSIFNMNNLLKILHQKESEAKHEKDIGKFTNLNEGHCTYWDQDLETNAYISISCWEWEKIVKDNPNKHTDCIVKECDGASSHVPNVIKYEGEWGVLYGWTSPQYMMGTSEPCKDAREKCKSLL